MSYEFERIDSKSQTAKPKVIHISEPTFTIIRNGPFLLKKPLLFLETEAPYEWPVSISQATFTFYGNGSGNTNFFGFTIPKREKPRLYVVEFNGNKILVRTCPGADCRKASD